MNPLLEVDDLSIWFSSRGTGRPVVSSLNLSLAAGEVLGLVGESGSGKSVTALAIMRLLAPSARVEGSVRFQGDNLFELSGEAMRSRRGRDLAMIFQEPMTALNPVMTIGEQVAEAVRAHQPKLSRRQVRQTVVEALEAVAIPEPAARYTQYPHQFSGGQRQRILIAMAIANRPRLLIADEPTTALDVTVQAQVLSTLKTALNETRASLLLITHDLGVIAGLADRVLVMYAGRPVEIGSVEEIFYAPSMPYTHGLLGSLPRVDSDGTERLRQIPGSPPTLVGDRVGCHFADEVSTMPTASMFPDTSADHEIVP